MPRGIPNPLVGDTLNALFAERDELRKKLASEEVTETMADEASKVIFAYNLRKLDDMSIDDKIKYQTKIAKRAVEAALKARKA